MIVQYGKKIQLHNVTWKNVSWISAEQLTTKWNKWQSFNHDPWFMNSRLRIVRFKSFLVENHILYCLCVQSGRISSNSRKLFPILCFINKFYACHLKSLCSHQKSKRFENWIRKIRRKSKITCAWAEFKLSEYSWLKGNVRFG